MPEAVALMLPPLPLGSSARALTTVTAGPPPPGGVATGGPGVVPARAGAQRFHVDQGAAAGGGVAGEGEGAVPAVVGGLYRSEDLRARVHVHAGRLDRDGRPGARRELD